MENELMLNMEQIQSDTGQHWISEYEKSQTAGASIG